MVILAFPALRVPQEKRYRKALLIRLFYFFVYSHFDLKSLLSVKTGRARYGRKRRERHGWTPRIKGDLKHAFTLYKHQ